jgi:hypothetical protein
VTAAIGVAAHSAWAVVVVVAGLPPAPLLIDRRRIELLGGEFPAQAYHAANAPGLALPEAAALVERCEAAATAGAERGLRGAADAARDSGHEPVACVIVGEQRELPELATILRSHALLHSGEGQLARAAIARAAAALGLDPVHVPARTAAVEAAGAAIAELGQMAGPPWSADYRTAAAVALTALQTGLRSREALRPARAHSPSRRGPSARP